MDQPFNLMALLQAAQQPGMRGMGAGPVPMQNPTPGFRAPGLMGGGSPGIQQPQGNGDLTAGIGGLAGAMGRMKSDPMAQAAKQRTADGGDMGGYSKAQPGGMFQMPDGTWVQNPNDPASYGAQPPAPLTASGAQPGFMDFLTGRMNSLFGPSSLT